MTNNEWIILAQYGDNSPRRVKGTFNTQEEAEQAAVSMVDDIDMPVWATVTQEAK